MYAHSLAPRRPSTLPTRPSTRLSTLPTRPSTLPTPDVMACNRRAWRRPCASPWDEQCRIELRRLIMSPCPRASLSAITTPRSRRRRRSLEGNERVRPGHEPRHDRVAPCTRHDRDAPCTRFSCILWRAWCVCVCVLSCRLCVLLCLVALGAVAPVPLEALRGFVSRGGDGRHHDVASRCGITMRHHDAHAVERVGFFSRRAVKELTVSDGATALPTPRTCTGRLYYFII